MNSDDDDKPNLRKVIMDAENEDEVNNATLPKTKDEILPQVVFKFVNAVISLSQSSFMFIISLFSL